MKKSILVIALITALTACNEKNQIKSATLIRSDFKPGEITKLCDESITNMNAAVDKIIKIDPNKMNFDNTMLALENAGAIFSDEMYPLTFMSYVSTDEALRDEGAQCEEKMGKATVEIYTNKSLYTAVKSSKARNTDEERLLLETLKGFEANGLNLPDDKLAKMRELKGKLTELESKFSANLNNEVSSVKFSASELSGCPNSFLARLKKDTDGLYIVTTKSTDYSMVMENASADATRKKMLLAYQNRAAGTNVPLLEQAILLRQEIAKLMGFKTWADYRTNGRMANDGSTVLTFLNGLKDKLAKKNKEDLEKLLDFKKQTLDPAASEIKAWDIAYTSYQLKKRDFTLDDEVIREYFPAEVVVKGMFEIYSTLFGVNFEEIKNAAVWDKTVKLFKVTDKDSGSLVSYFYMDFVPRDGKYGHAAAFQLISGRVNEDGSYNIPVSSIVANFTPPNGDTPSLLVHDEVETIFHEFGHIMHQTLTKARYSSLAGSNTLQDYVEAPSQMLENWVWNADILKIISGHYKEVSKKLPKEILEKMLDAKNFNQGYFYTRQLMLGLMDMSYHTAIGAVDTTAVMNKIYKDIIGIDPVEGGHFQAGFGHLMGGYDAGYYGYLWSEVYAADMFTRFQSEGLLNSKTGMDYRESILGQGNMKNPLDLVTLFLGRLPNSEAFFKKLGIN